MAKHRIYTMSFASVYPHYVAKAEKKGRTKAEVDQIITLQRGCVLDGAQDGRCYLLSAATPRRGHDEF